MPRAAVLGKPIAHSLSPVIHTAGYAAAGLSDWSYTAIECAEAELPGLLTSFGPEWAGLSLTMPLKAAALRVASQASPTARALGAANTLVRRGDGWYAENTDAPGMVDALRGADLPPAPTVAVLGGGGTARAALGAARDLDAVSVTVYTRRPEAFDELLPVSDALVLPIIHAPWSDAHRCAEAAVVISTVPKGAADDLATAIDWRPDGVLLDVLYDPWPTPLAVAARAAGWRVVSGLDLLLAQAVRQFDLFTGVPAPVDAMRSAVASAAGRD
ncbi:MAG TPA: shikimate dehydrogenase [Micromonosporaceae bacterium]